MVDRDLEHYQDCGFPRETPPIDVVVLENIRTTGQRCPSDPLVEILITDINCRAWTDTS